jgi:hypothetical protein
MAAGRMMGGRGQHEAYALPSGFLPKKIEIEKIRNYTKH